MGRLILEQLVVTDWRTRFDDQKRDLSVKNVEAENSVVERSQTYVDAAECR